MMRVKENVQAVMQALEEAGFEAYAVGGAVRDSLLGKEPFDWDVTTSALPEQVMERFGDAAIPTGLKHGTVTVLRDGERIEVTTYRKDGDYADHRHPVAVEFTPSLKEDLQRRDFTVNAIALSWDGIVIDPFDGQSDLAAGVLRAVGDAEQRFEEDALRILRGLRFASVLDFAVEEQSALAMRAKKELLREIAAERVLEELTKLLCGKAVRRVLMEFSDVLGVVLPEILPSVDFDHRNPHHCYDVWEHTACAVESIPAEPILRWTMLLHDLGKPAVCVYDYEAGKARYGGHQAASVELAKGILPRLRFDGDSTRRILRLVEHHDRLFDPTEKSIRRMLRLFGEEDLRALIHIRRADNLAQHPDFRGRQAELAACDEVLEKVLAEQQCFSLAQLAVNGRDLMELGCSGKEIGEMLDALLTAVVDERLPNEKEALLSEAKKRR